MTLPQNQEPVLARISGVTDLGRSEWWEVVYYDDEQSEWCSFAGSDTFEDGERVIRWRGCDALADQNLFYSC
jgi:hypothetical protein